MKIILRLFGIRSDFDRLFFINESQSLSGEKNRVVLALIVILFFTLIALGFAVGSIENLEKKMSNPFTNWVNLEVSSEFMSQRAQSIVDTYTKDEYKESLLLKDVRGWVKFNLEFFHQDYDPTIHVIDTLSYATWGRSIEDEDPLLDEVMKPENLVIGPSTTESYDSVVEDCRVVITEDLALRLGFSLDQPIETIFMKDGIHPMVVQVAAVVKELPKYCDFICSPQMYNIKNAKIEEKDCGSFIHHPREGDTGFQFIVSSDDQLNYKSRTNSFFVGQENPSFRIIDPFNSGSSEYAICELSFAPVDRPTLDSVNLFIESLRTEGLPISNMASMDCGVDYCYEISPINYYYLAFNFERLDNVRQLRDDMEEQFNIPIDMSQVEAKENFALVSQLTLIISSVLLAFGVLSIILFVNNLLKSHLFKVRPHLGTFQAFGLNNKFLTRLYCRIILAFLCVSIAIAMVASILVEFIEQAIQGEDSRFDIFDPWIAGAIGILVTISLIVSLRTIKSILGDTPGNLIYQR